MARILVGVMTRNRPDYVRETVQSILKQTYRDIRVIVSENPSEPEVSASVSRWVESLNDPRISYHLQAIDGGEYGQGRYLFGECQEDYFCIMHDDDLMEPRYLEYALGVLDAEQDIAFLSSSQHLIDGEGIKQPELTRTYSANQGRDEFPEGRMSDPLIPLLTYGLFSISGSVFRRSRIAEHGLVDADIGGIYPFEFNVFLRLTERGLPAWYTPEHFIAYRWHSSSMSQTDGSIMTRYMVETLVTLLKRRQFDGVAEQLRRRLLAFNLRNLGLILLAAGERKDALHVTLEAARLHPKSPGLWLSLIMARLAPGYLKSKWRDKVNLAPPSPSWALAIPENPLDS